MRYKSYLSEVEFKIAQAKERALRAMGIAAVSGVIERMKRGYFPTQKRNGQMSMQIRDTGALMRDVNAEVSAATSSVIIGVNMKYALWVHEGTRFIRPRPFLKDGVMESEQKLFYAAQQEFEKAMQ